MSAAPIQDELISIIMPCHDSEAYLEAAVNSVLSQTWPNWELIAVDDASQDKTASRLKSFSEEDPRIIAVCNASQAPYSGVGWARNMALGMARGRYVAFLDSDDLWLPEKLEFQLRYMRQHELALCSTQLETIGPSGESKGVYLPKPGVYDFNYLLFENVASTSAMMVDRLKCPDLRFGSMKKAEDYYAWMNQVLKGHKIQVMPGRYTRYRLRSFSLPAKLRDAGIRIHVNHRYFNVGWLKQLVLFMPYIFKSLLKMKTYYGR
jgi:teichuronic acid biosynthesis glycosyltransferase TuaG